MSAYWCIEASRPRGKMLSLTGYIVFRTTILRYGLLELGADECLSDGLFPGMLCRDHNHIKCIRTLPVLGS